MSQTVKGELLLGSNSDNKGMYFCIGLIILFLIVGYYYFNKSSTKKVSFEKEMYGDAITKGKKVIIMLWAIGCGFCDKAKPDFKKIMEDTPNAYMVEFNEDLDLAKSFGVSAFPTYLVFKGGKLIAKDEGVKQYNELKKYI